ncbi:hypothetical protein [Catellatospora sp. NPDC049133]|uniref:hypothetical protein n=1 Tax=Catellatospora sp. NPDC049133 TaxID=3155499 RepID=UPI0033D2849C
MHTAAWLFPYGELPVDLITLAGVEATAEQAAENLLALPQRQLNAELGVARSRGRPVPTWLRELVAGDHEARRDLVLALRELQHAAIAGTAGRIAGVLDDEQAEFGRVLLSEGVGEAGCCSRRRSSAGPRRSSTRHWISGPGCWSIPRCATCGRRRGSGASRPAPRTPRWQRCWAGPGPRCSKWSRRAR